ncbi:TetR/AcrR family transcriptional regulator [Streptomyces sp. NPDC001933]|uniref:TetR/AcrR family transcriptional regulator n=1 Tax=Streptomyces sp. NPDC001933 TaxID=3364626 RepID=UPI0036A703E4
MPRRAARQDEAARNDRALLAAAKHVLAADGARASVASIAAKAGVGMATVYRRYRTKREFFQYLCVLALRQRIEAAENALAMDDPWDGLVHYITRALDFGGGSLGSLAGTIEVNDEMASAFTRSDELRSRLVRRAHAAQVLRADVTDVDLDLLIEQLGQPGLVEQLDAQGRDDQLDEARSARHRMIAIAVDGLRRGAPQLPGEPPRTDLLSQRWSDPPTDS